MKKHLFLHLSFVGLLGLSTIAYGGWTKYGPNFKSGDPIPNGDCMEMICEYGCVERNGEYGVCCPGNGQCRVESGEDVDLCCADDEFCDNGTCRRKTCSFGGNIYGDYGSVGECGKCVNGLVVQDTSKTMPICKSSCNTTTWNWNNAADDTKIDDCHICKNGQKENVPDGTKPDNCHVCQNGSKMNEVNGTVVGECGKCQNGSVVQDTNQKAPICKTTCNITTWLWNNAVDNTKVDDCHVCISGQTVNTPDGTKVKDCGKCHNGEIVLDTSNDCSNECGEKTQWICPEGRCLNTIDACGNDALGFSVGGHTYCYNSKEELTRRCREAVPHTTSCHNGHCFYASNNRNEDVPGNCHWGYYDWQDVNNWCKSKGGTLVSKSEIENIWDGFLKCDPPFGKRNEACYWTSTWNYCRNKNGSWNRPRNDGYINAGAALCRID